MVFFNEIIRPWPFFDVFAPGPTPAFGFLVNVMSSLSFHLKERKGDGELREKTR